MLIDLHTHTFPLSQDSYVSPDDLVERSRKAGLDAICLSEHDALWDTEAVRELSKRHNFLVLPAIEITTDEGHMLCYGVNTFVRDFYRSQELAAHVLSVRGAMVGAHPFRRQMPWSPIAKEEEHLAALEKASRNPAYAFCSALERINGRGSPAENAFAARLCDLMGMPGTGGTDAHQISDIGKCATQFERSIESVQDLIEELKAGRFRAVSLVETPAVAASEALSAD
jgi:predicted metal-dependent phosphoesterase TrpH